MLSIPQQIQDTKGCLVQQIFFKYQLSFVELYFAVLDFYAEVQVFLYCVTSVTF